MNLSPFITDEDVIRTVKLLNENDVIGQVSKTGSGKTTIFIPKLYQKSGEKATIFSVQQTIPAVREVTRRVKQTLGDKIVGSAAESRVTYRNEFLTELRESAHSPAVGRFKYPIRKRDFYTDDSKIVYTTAKHLEKVMIDVVKYVNKFGANNTNVSFCDFLIIDEAHSGNLEIEIIMALWKFLYEHGAIVPKLILTSATLDMKLTQFPNAVCQNIITRTFEVKIEYHTQDYKPNSDVLYSDTVDVVLKNHKKLTEYLDNEKGDTWIIFCPGYNEVTKVISLLRTKGDDSLILIPAYSELSPEETDLIFSNPPEYTRRIIVATNFLESAVTVNGVTYIYDTLTEKITETSITGGIRLDLVNITKFSAKQRAGRTGRTCTGTVYRMCKENSYATFLDQKSSEIDRIPLFTTVIKLVDLELNAMQLFPKLNPKKFSNCIKLLTELNLLEIDVKNSDSEGTKFLVNEGGVFCAKFPFGVKNTVILYKWIKEGYPVFPCIVLVCLIDSFSQGYFFYPKKLSTQSNEEYKAIFEGHYEKHFRQYYHESDLGILLNLYLDFLSTHKTFNVPYKNIIVFSNSRNLNNRKFSDFLTNLRQSIKILENSGYVIEPSLFDVNNILNLVQPILLDIFETDICTRGRDRKNNIIYKR